MRVKPFHLILSAIGESIGLSGLVTNLIGLELTF